MVPGKPDHEALFRENLHGWNAMAPIHARGSGAPFYRIDEFLAGECKLGPWEIEEVGPVDGKNLLHLQCHIGLDTLSWARRGARVTGLDFSPASIDEARKLASRADLDAHFVVGRVQEASRVLDGEQFDLIYTGRGAICWLPDLTTWARECAALAKPGAIFYMEETHPTLDLLNLVEGPGGPTLVPHYDPFSGEPVSDTSEGTYADRSAPTGPMRMHCWDHGFGELLEALTGAGFDFVHLHERDEAFFEPFEGVFEPSRPNYWRLKEAWSRVPLSYTLKMRRSDKVDRYP